MCKGILAEARAARLSGEQLERRLRTLNATLVRRITAGTLAVVHNAAQLHEATLGAVKTAAATLQTSVVEQGERISGKMAQNKEAINSQFANLAQRVSSSPRTSRIARCKCPPK